jgi:hypothetical protein
MLRITSDRRGNAADRRAKTQADPVPTYGREVPRAVIHQDRLGWWCWSVFDGDGHTIRSCRGFEFERQARNALDRLLSGRGCGWLENRIRPTRSD